LLFIVGNQAAEPGWLCLDTFPAFKTSVVSIGGALFVPHSYSSASGECRCIGEDPNRPGCPIFYIFADTIIDAMQPFGRLPWGVVGWKKDGTIQVIPNTEPPKLYTKPLTFQTVTWHDLIEAASLPENKQHKKPRNRIKRLDKTNCWQAFDAYKFRHWWAGNNLVLRHHAFFRNIREVPTSSNVIRKGKTINYINAKGDKWLFFCKKTNSWKPCI